MKKINEIIDSAIIYVLRKSYFAIISDIGKCDICNDKIVCIVDENKIKKDSFNSWNYKLVLNGISKKFRENNKKVLKKCGLDKKIIYIIENINFDKRVYIDSYDSEIIFKNCSFVDGIHIINADNIIFENNTYVLKDNKNRFGIATRDVEDVKCIKFVNDNIFVTREEESNDEILMNLDLFSKKVEIINTKVTKNSSVLVDTKELVISESTINSDELYITAEVIESHNSVANIKEGIIAENSDTYVDKYTLEQRKKLLNSLIKIREQCNSCISEKMIEVATNAQKESIKKVLKK